MSSKPAIVFVPGAWIGPDEFRRVADSLEAAGYEVKGVDLPSGGSVPIHDFGPDVELIQATVREFADQGKDVLLVLHSYGGVVGSEAVKGLDKATREKEGLKGGISHLYFCSAFIIPENVSISEALGNKPLPWFQLSDDQLTVTPKIPPEIVYSDVEDRSIIPKTIRPHSYRTFFSKVTYAGWKYVPNTFLLCTKDVAIPLAKQKAMVDQARSLGADFETDEVDANHNAFLSKPEEVAFHFEFVALLGDLCTLDGVTQAVDHMQDLLRRHQDRPSTRNYGPTLMLLLDQDQECYDLVRAWTMDVRNLDLYPHDPDWVSPPTIQPGADVLEDVAYLEENEKHFCLVAAVLLLKMKLLVDVINIVRVRRVASIIEHDNYHPLGHIPHEIWTQVWKQVELQIIRSPLSRQWVTQPDALVKGVLGKLEDHVTRLIGAVHRMNSLFTCCLLAPIDLIENYAISYQQRSTSQMQLYVMLCYSAWWNHVGVLELLQSANSITLEWAKRNPADMLAELMKDPGFVAGRVFKSKQALMPALTGDLTPLYFDLVVEDATSFTRVPKLAIVGLVA
ncbi:hypothetical protein DV738_g1083, partial [Chaetothyriales sp. CBS 135597]